MATAHGGIFECRIIILIFKPESRVNSGKLDDLSNLSMLELFRVEAETQVAALTSGLLELERNPAAQQQLETLMRAAHSMKGAARIVNLQAAVSIAHAMEDCFFAAQNAQLTLNQSSIDLLLRGVDLLLTISKRTESDIAQWEAERGNQMKEFLGKIAELMPDQKTTLYSH